MKNKPKTVKAQKRLQTFLPKGVPKFVRIYDYGEFGDRYTCVFTGKYRHNTGGSYWYLGFSAYPFHPQGMGYHGERRRPIDVAPGAWSGPAIGKKSHLGTRIKFEDLPEDGKKFVLQEYLYLFSFTDEDGKFIN
jgi:hypothetical protein